jgi:hypothetical protein
MQTSKLLQIAAAILAVMSLVVVGLATLTAGPADADAVIWDLVPGERSNTARFVDLLDRMGHEEPRPFSVNGNRVWISTARTAKAPRDVLFQYQHALKTEGLNTGVFDSVTEGESRQGRYSALTGGLSPTHVSDDYVAMGGVVPANDAESPAELAELAQRGTFERFKAFRSVEAFREPGSSWTTVVAVFSDESFDYRNMVPGNETRGEYDPDVPACPGCVRLQRFADLSAADHVSTLFSSSMPPAEVARFYERAFTARGWAPAENNASLERIDAVVAPESKLAEGRLDYSRDGRHAAVTLVPRPEGGTFVDVRLRQ